LMDLKVSSTAVATRNPRLIMVVIDRSASMLEPGGGASGLPPAVVQFLDFFDTSSDNIGIVSFGSAARLEMPMTTNFIIAGTNNLVNAYETNSYSAEPGVDPETDPSRSVYDPNYATTGVRRLKFGGSTAADDGIRLGLEQLMANSGFNDPDVVKYMVIFTDGKWNASRTLFAAPGYTNEVYVPAAFSANQAKTNKFLTNDAALAMTNGQIGLWDTTLANDTNIIPMPSMGMISNQSDLPFVTNAMAHVDQPGDFSQLVADHTNDVWLSADATTNEPLLNPGSTIIGGSIQAVTNSTLLWISSNASGLKTNYYTHTVDVWLQPGSVAYCYTNATLPAHPVAYVSDYTNPTQDINLYVGSGGKVDLVVPGYIVDGLAYDGLDLPVPDTGGYPRYRQDNYQQPYLWNDDTAPNTEPYSSTSLQRQLMFRNYPNLLTGFYVSRADDPLGAGYEPLITEDNPPGAPRPLNGLGPYYPGAAFYWPFDLTGLDPWYTYVLTDPGGGGPSAARHDAYSINMLSTNAAPEWSGELFYNSVSGSGTNVVSGTGNTAASQIMQSDDWQNGVSLIPYLSALANVSGLMTNEATHNTNITGSPSVWRPVSFNGLPNTATTLSSVTPSGTSTGGWVSDGNGNYYPNTMAWSGRPTHYYDFSKSTWVAIADNHDTNIQFLQMGNWKAQEYAWHARALGVTIYTVGYGTLVTDAQQAFLAQLANATNTTAGGGSNMPYNASQPIGAQFYATNAAQISNDFYSVGQAINEALTQ
jgi:hypothetical protein